MRTNEKENIMRNHNANTTGIFTKRLNGRAGRLLLPLIALLLLFPAALTAQDADAPADTVATETPEVPAEPPRTVPATALERSDMEQRLDNLIKGAMNNFFDPSTYMVDTKVNLERVRKRLPESAPTEMPRTRVRENLPGLPGVPTSLLRPQEGMADAAASEMTNEISSIDVTVLVSTAYTDEEIGFIDRLVRATAKIDEGRGDIVAISRTAFPTRQADRADETTAPQPMDTDVLPSPESDETGNWFAENRAWLIALLILLALLIALALFFVRKKKKDALSAESRGFTPDDSTPDSGTPIADAPAMGKAGTDLATDNNEAFLLQSILSYPGEIARLFESWIARDPANGSRRAASLLSSADPKTARLLQPGMSESAYGKLLKAMEGVPSADVQADVASVCNYLRSRYRDDTLRKGLRALNDYDFLDHIPVDKLFGQLQRYGSKEKALILSHLNSVAAAGIIQRLEPGESRAVMLELPKTRNVPFAGYRKLAEDLFENLNVDEAPDAFSAEDVQQTVQLIESLPVGQQSVYTEQLASDSGEFAASVLEELITLPTLDRLSDQDMADGIAAIDSQVLGTALATLDSKLANRILSLRPEREQIIIRAEMQGAAASANGRVEAAQNRMLEAIRSYIRKNKTMA